jgi:hypothetical protein
MNRTLLFGIAWIILGAGLAGAAPARPLYQPKAREHAASPNDALHGSTWEGVCFNSPCVIKLKGDGTLQYYNYSRKGGGKDLTSPSPGLWRFAGEHLIFEINKYSEHRGVYCGDIIHGESTNKAGSRGKFSLHRVIPTP